MSARWLPAPNDMGRLKDVLEQQSSGTFVGRGEELESLLSVLSEDGPLAVCVHGIAGIGKSRLLEAFAGEARSRGATVVRLDCRQIEPTESGLLREFSAAIGGEAGWLARLVSAELGLEESGLLDSAARELVIDGRRIGLTKLEFGVMEYLTKREGQAVSRAALLESVWGQTHNGGSNVVDAVVRGLRKKLADRAARIESVQGMGYRLRGEQG